MDLKEAITTASSSVPSRSTMPILNTVAIKSEGGKIELTGTDLEVGIKVSTEYDAPDFACCVDAKRLVAAINIIDKPKFRLTDKHIIVQQGSMRFTLPHFPFDNHPGLAEADESDVLISGDVVKLMADVRYAQAKNDVRFYLNGVYLCAENGKLSVIASNGHRVAIRYKECDQNFKIILPTNAVNNIIKHRPDTISIGRMVRCIKPDFEMVCKPIDGKFPEFSRMLGTSSDTLTIEKSDINLTLSALASLRDVSPLAAVKMEWEKDELLMSARGGDNSEIENKMPASFTKNGAIGLNANYLNDLVSAVDSKEVRLEFSDSSLSIISRRENAIDLIMSMRI